MSAPSLTRIRRSLPRGPGPGQGSVAARQRVMNGTYPVEMPDHGTTAGYDDRAPARLGYGLCHFDGAPFDTAAHKRGQHLDDDRTVCVAAV